MASGMGGEESRRRAKAGRKAEGEKAEGWKARGRWSGGQRAPEPIEGGAPPYSGAVSLFLAAYKDG